MSELVLKINSKEFPFLDSIKKKDINKLLADIFKIGYMIYFPNKDKTLEKQEYEEIKSSIIALREEISESDISEIGDKIIEKINEKIEPLNNSLSKLLGLQNASSKKGELAENIIQHAFTTRYGDLLYEDKSQIAHSGDAWIHLPDNKIIMIETKNYTNTVNKAEIEKMEYDMKFNNIRFCLFLSLNASIQGFRDMDFHTFTNNGENYFAIMVSNLSNNISKLDLAFNMIRKLSDMLNTPDKFPWIQKKIHDGLNKINEIINKNYLLRTNFYSLEKTINNAMDTYHKELRDYQYDLEQSIKELTIEINSTMINSTVVNKTTADILLEHKNKKIYSVVSHIGDILHKKKWEIKLNGENKYEVYNKNNKIGQLDIQLKKAILNFPENQLDLIFNSGNNKQNKKNLEILDNNF
jgi:hypothetical protein